MNFGTGRRIDWFVGDGFGMSAGVAKHERSTRLGIENPRGTGVALMEVVSFDPA